MTWFAWVVWTLIVLLWILMTWIACARPQARDPLAGSQERFERQLEQLIVPAPLAPTRPAQKRTTPRPRRAPSMFAPAPGPLPDLPRVDASTLPEEPPPRPCCAWTEEARQQRAQVRETASE